jgi:DNA processing protein
MTPEAWQLLLAAELPPHKLRALQRELGAFSSDAIERIRNFKDFSKAEADRVKLADMTAVSRALEAGAVLRESDEYPERLAKAKSVPPALFAWGDWECVRAPSVAIVGTREATTYGRATAQKFAEHLARCGVTVVSGGAIGIDAAAHKGALEGGGKTVAVMGSGIDKVYPALHRGLFAQIRESGCLVSQFAAGMAPNGYKFLMRNILVAALSDAVLVVEAPERSGALFTANAANEAGRQVFVVPANIDNANFRGAHALIRHGATLVDHPAQILEDLGVDVAGPEREPLPELSPAQQQIVQSLSVSPVAAELIVERTGLAPAEVMSELTMLELEGRILRDGGGYALKP